MVYSRHNTYNSLSSNSLQCEISLSWWEFHIDVQVKHFYCKFRTTWFKANGVYLYHDPVTSLCQVKTMNWCSKFSSITIQMTHFARYYFRYWKCIILYLICNMYGVMHAFQHSSLHSIQIECMKTLTFNRPMGMFLFVENSLNIFHFIAFCLFRKQRTITK